VACEVPEGVRCRANVFDLAGCLDGLADSRPCWLRDWEGDDAVLACLAGGTSSLTDGLLVARIGLLGLVNFPAGTGRPVCSLLGFDEE
jgi:hypothetical protein